MTKFSQLQPPSVSNEHWLRQKQEAQERLATPSGDRLTAELARRVSDALSTKSPGEDERLEHWATELLSALGDTVSLQDGPDGHLLSALATRALAAVAQGGASETLLRYIAMHERLVDFKSLARIVAANTDGTAWLTLLGGLKLDVLSIDDDEFRAKDALSEWQQQISMPVPSWKSDGSPSLATPLLQLVSALFFAFSEKHWLRFLDNLPLPQLAESLLWFSGCSQHPQLLVEWLRVAPALFDATGHRTSSYVSYLLERQSIEAIISHLTPEVRWDTSDKRIGELVSSVSEACLELARSLCERSDARILLCELGASKLGRAQRATATSPQTLLREHLDLALAGMYASALGTPTEVQEISRSRSEAFNGRSAWAFWLFTSWRTCQLADGENVQNEKELAALTDGYWRWLETLLSQPDAAITESRHFGHWVEFLMARALLAGDDPTGRLDSCWTALAAQRTAPTDGDDYEARRQKWIPSRLLVRTGFTASRLQSEAPAALWSISMEMAISLWLSSTAPNSFNEVSFGLAHLARASYQVSGQPGQTLEYLVGDVDHAVEALLALLANGFSPRDVCVASTQAGVPAEKYLTLSRDRRRDKQVAEALLAIRAVMSTEPDS